MNTLQKIGLMFSLILLCSLPIRVAAADAAVAAETPVPPPMASMQDLMHDQYPNKCNTRPGMGMGMGMGGGMQGENCKHGGGMQGQDKPCMQGGQAKHCKMQGGADAQRLEMLEKRMDMMQMMMEMMMRSGSKN